MCLCIYFIVHSMGELSLPFIIVLSPLLFLYLPRLHNLHYFSLMLPRDIQVFMYLVHLNMKHSKLNFHFYFAHATPVSSHIQFWVLNSWYCFLKKQNYFIYIYIYKMMIPWALLEIQVNFWRRRWGVASSLIRNSSASSQVQKDDENLMVKNLLRFIPFSVQMDELHMKLFSVWTN